MMKNYFLKTVFLVAFMSFLGMSVNAQVFSENFDAMSGTGGNDGLWSGSIASSTLTLANWTFTSGYAANKCVKVGAGSTQGSIQTPSVTLTKDAVLTFRAGAWNTASEQTELLLLTTAGSLDLASVTLTKGAFNSYSVNITYDEQNPAIKITFKGKQASNSRFFLDDVVITEKESSSIGNASNRVAKISVVGNSLVFTNINDGAVVGIFNALGARVKTATTEDGKVAIPGLAKGVYIVKVGGVTQKVLVK